MLMCSVKVYLSLSNKSKLAIRVKSVGDEYLFTLKDKLDTFIRFSVHRMYYNVPRLS